MKSELYDENRSHKSIEELEELIEENEKLIKENNELLRKLHRGAVWAFWLRILWLAIFLGLPLLAYYYLFMPYYETFQDAFASFGVNIPELGTNDFFSEEN